jgi:hypothetical protein
MASKRNSIVKGYASMWPREVFDAKPKRGGGVLAAQLEFLTKEKGVYVLYRDGQPYYIGKSGDSLFARLSGHAMNPRRRYYNFWDMFSAFAVPDKKGRDELEGILIAAMPTANGSKPRLSKERLPKQVTALMKKLRQAKIEPALSDD